MLKRLMGAILIVVGLMGLAVSVIGVRIGGQVVNQIGNGFDETLTLLLDTMENTNEMIAATRSTIVSSSETLDTVQTMLNNLAQTVGDTEPLLTHTNVMLTDEVPASLEGVQDTIPTLAAVATSIDDTLTTLNNFRIDETLPLIGVNINYSLGIDYAPDQPFDAAIEQIGDSLEGLPDSLRSMEGSINNAVDNMAVVQGDLELLATDLEQMQAEVDAFLPMIDEYGRVTLEISDHIRQSRSTLDAQLEMLNSLILFGMVWLALFQILPLYVGFELVRGQEMVRNNE